MAAKSLNLVLDFLNGVPESVFVAVYLIVCNLAIGRRGLRDIGASVSAGLLARDQAD